jgi:hypothetical protein
MKSVLLALFSHTVKRYYLLLVLMGSCYSNDGVLEVRNVSHNVSVLSYGGSGGRLSRPKDSGSMLLQNVKKCITLHMVKSQKTIISVNFWFAEIYNSQIIKLLRCLYYLLQ